MKKFVLTLCVFGYFSFSNAQSTDEKIAEAMNNSDWFALDSLYRTESKDSIDQFLEIFSRCLIGNRLNRPDVSSLRLRNYSRLNRKTLVICSIRQ